MTEYYQREHAQRATLAKSHPDGYCRVTSANGANTCEVAISNAARLLTAGSHRLATDAEDRAFQATQEMGRVKSPLVESLEAARAQFAALMAGKEGPQ
jgi:hypothetical protein